MRRTHQLLIVDNRGTGASSAIDCPALQSYEGDYIRNVRRCARQLGADSDVWGTAFAADDMAAVLDHLGTSQVDLYGDSYGTFFAQAFAIRHPERVRTAVMNAAYPVDDQNPWYPDLNRALVAAFARSDDVIPAVAPSAAVRSPACAAWPAGSPMSRSPGGRPRRTARCSA